jgi:geranylgeranyl diphosphate synthase, type II
MLSIENAQNIIMKELEKLNVPDTPSDLYDPVRYILFNGGKRIRPSLVLLGCDLFGEDYMKAIGPALGIEVFHNFTLLHDDLMDNSNVRRKNPTVHIRWNPNVAILSGDVMSILSNQLVCNVEKQFLAPVISLFNTTALEVCEGQMMDMNFEQQENVSIPGYLKMVGLKTSVLMAASLKMGAIIAEAAVKDCEDIYDFGYNLGMAFQLQDDLLDTYGDAEIFGKKIGNDIVTNKKTFLMIKALELATGEKLKQLKTILSTTDTEANEKIFAVKEIFDELNIPSLTKNRINQYFEKASLYLEAIMVNPERKKVLNDFSRTLMARDF